MSVAMADVTGKPRIIDGDTVEIAGERRRRGALCVTLEIGWNDLGALGALGLLNTDEADPVKISGAVRAHLDQSLTTPRKPARSSLE